jgi:hypothetical protein
MGVGRKNDRYDSSNEPAAQIEVATEGKAPEVINIMAALKESMGRAKLRDPVRRRIGKPEKGSGKAASVAPEANLAPGRRQVGATHRGGTATGESNKTDRRLCRPLT